MKIVPASNGLEWEDDGNCYLDAIPLPPRNTRPLTIKEEPPEEPPAE